MTSNSFAAADQGLVKLLFFNGCRRNGLPLKSLCGGICTGIIAIITIITIIKVIVIIDDVNFQNMMNSAWNTYLPTWYQSKGVPYGT